MGQGDLEKSERYKLGPTRVENKMERKGAGRTEQEVWGHGYRGWVEKLRTMKAQSPELLPQSWIHLSSANLWEKLSLPCWAGWGSGGALLAVPQEVPEVCEEPPGSSSDGDSLGCHHDATQPSFLCWGCSSAFPFVVINYRIETATKVQGYAVKHRVLQLRGFATFIPLFSSHKPSPPPAPP